MTSFVIALYIFKFLVTLVAYFRAKLKLVAIFLLGSLGFDILSQSIKSLNHYPKPYAGNGLCIFLASTLFYLSYPALLMLCAGLATKSKTLQQLAPLSLASIMIFIIAAYPGVSGASLISAFYAYYATIYLTVLLNLIKSFKVAAVTLDKLLLALLTLGGITECFLLIRFNYAWLSLSNFVFYSLTLIASLLSPLYKRLLPPSEQ